MYSLLCAAWALADICTAPSWATGREMIAMRASWILPQGYWGADCNVTSCMRAYNHRWRTRGEKVNHIAYFFNPWAKKGPTHSVWQLGTQYTPYNISKKLVTYQVPWFWSDASHIVHFLKKDSILAEICKSLSSVKLIYERKTIWGTDIF